MARSFEVSGRRLQPSGEQQGRGPIDRRGGFAGGVESGRDALCTPGVTEHDPGPSEPVHDAQREEGFVGDAPAEGGVDVGSFGPGERKMVGLTGAADATRGGCGGLGEPSGVGGQRDLAEPGLRHRLEGECTDAVEQPVAAVGRGVVVDDQEGAAGQTADHVDRRRRRDTEGVEDELDRAERCPSGERGQRPQAALVVGEQQVVAPADRRSERPTPFGLATGRVVQHPEPVVESPNDVLHRQRPGACRGKLDRQRQPIERTAQLVDRIVEVTDDSDRRAGRWPDEVNS